VTGEHTPAGAVHVLEVVKLSVVANARCGNITTNARIRRKNFFMALGRSCLQYRQVEEFEDLRVAQGAAALVVLSPRSPRAHRVATW
jgi:hypothetical protein